MRRTDGRALCGALSWNEERSNARQHAGVEASGDTIIHWGVFTLRKGGKQDEEKPTRCLGARLERLQRAK